MKLMCTCIHESQDKLYGKGVRIFNYSVKNEAYRCTICLALRKHNQPTVKKDTK